MTENNAFKALKKSTGKRGKGMAAPPKPRDIEKKVRTVDQPEAAPAVPVKPEKVRRSYRVSTLIKEEAGERLERLKIIIRKESGKKPKDCEVLELGLEALEKRYSRKT